MAKASAIQPQFGNRPRGKIEVLPNAIHTITVDATLSCYGVLGLAEPHLRYGHAVVLSSSQNNRGVKLHIINDQITIDVYVVLEYGLRLSEIANNIMGRVKFAIEHMLGIPVVSVNINIQGLLHGPATPDKIKRREKVHD
jgi:uncharacterized alkaline shock family protein YloU